MRFNGLPSQVDKPNPRRRVFNITVEVEAEPEDIPVRGNCSAIDPDTDREQERWIDHQLAGGNPWAWCHVTLRATMDGATGAESLGGCSYYSGADFCNPGGYFDDMVQQAVENMLTDRKERAEADGHGKFFLVFPGKPGVYNGPHDRPPDPPPAGAQVYQRLGAKMRRCKSLESKGD